MQRVEGEQRGVRMEVPYSRHQPEVPANRIILLNTKNTKPFYRTNRLGVLGELGG